MTQVDPSRMANAIRGLAMDAVEKAKSGHPGLPMGAADIATVLFTQFLKFDAADPKWPDRDRFILSAGHGSMLLYSLLLPDRQYRHDARPAQALPPAGIADAGPSGKFPTKGIETTTGPLGPGHRDVGRLRARGEDARRRVRQEVVDHHPYVLASDGDLMEGVSQEAIALAGHWKAQQADRLYDDNGISIDVQPRSPTRSTR